MENVKYYIAINAVDRYPLLKTPQDYTEYFNEALSFGDLFNVLRYIETTDCFCRPSCGIAARFREVLLF